MKQLYFLFFLVFFPILLSGQTNTDFWFAAPEVTVGHGDAPIYLRLTSFNQTANVTISEPANTVANFPPINVIINANSTFTVDLTPLKDQVECKPPNIALNLGILVHSDVPITAYYEVANPSNPDIFTLKGNNALGTSFFIPSQSVLSNHTPLTPPAYNTFDIIATTDATTVTITPRKDIVGHTAGNTFTVTLNKGQVYSAQATGQTGADHLMGSTVTSDNPVAITVKDDSDQYPGQGCYDLTGDQIVPVNIIGQQYIVVRGYTNTTVNDWVFVTATIDNTSVSVNGSVVATINAGATYTFNMTSTDLYSYVQTDQPVYLWHLTGYGCETGTAILPPMNCTGSSQVAFTRTTQFSFELIILTKAGAEGSFTMDGNPGIVTAGQFFPVTSNPLFVYARIDFTAATLPVGAHILANSQDIFHMGVIHTYNAGQAGCSYGYFTDFASLNLGPDKNVCPGITVTFDAGPNRQSYDWYYNGTPYSTGVQTITVSNPGLYSVTVNDHGCILSDEAQLSNYPLPSPAISGITSFCEPESQLLSVQGTFTSYLWTTGATTPSITVSTSGIYGVTVTDHNGCQGSTSVNVTVHPLPFVTLVQPASTCSNIAPYALTGGNPATGVYSGPGVNSVTGFFDPASGSGAHNIIYTYTDGFGCTNSDTKTLMVYDPTAVQLSDYIPVCISVPPFALSGGTPAGGVYSGPGVNSVTGFFDPSSGTGPHTITYTYTNTNACISIASKVLTVNPLPVVQLSAQPTVCISVPPFALLGGIPAGGVYSGPGVNSVTGFFDPSSGAGLHTITYTYTDANSCSSTDSKTLLVNPLPIVLLGAFSPVCISVPPFPLSGGTPAGGTYTGPGVNSVTGFFDPSSGTGPHTITYTYTDANGCTNSNSKTLLVNPLPVVNLGTFTPVCITLPAFLLSGGTPPGGIYSGTGVNSLTGMFNPASGAGLHVITYTYTDINSCTNLATSGITVIPLPLPSGTVSGPNPVCEATQNITYTLSGADPLATTFNWEISPMAAGTISGTNVSPSVNLNTGFSGTMSIRFQPVSNCGNGNFSGYTNTTVNPNPDVWLQVCNDAVTTRAAKPFQLKGGIPPGGIYGIDGTPLPTGILNPATLTAGPPDHTISYTYTNRFTCAITKTQSLKVNNASGFICKTTLTDIRDLKTYPTFEIVIGAIHHCWISANLNYGSFIQDNVVQTDNCNIEKYCQGNDVSKCAQSGGYYQWEELMNYLPVDNASAEGKQGLCPPEWHVPTEAEWAGLENYYSGEGLAGWSLIDPNPVYGFHARNLGVLYQNQQWAFMPPGFSATIFWTSTVSPFSNTRIFSHGMNEINASVSKYFSTPGNALPVRCVKD
ncbi:MAG: hypothetical protein NTY96_03490 [Bacteroidetes bacterium]|nr:hypothetical protein [Bacteroidota bacterium]